MQISKKILSMILAMVMVVGLMPATVVAAEETKLTLEELRAQYGAITVEAYTIGQGFLVEPTLYTKVQGKDTASITIELLDSKGIEYKAQESQDGGFSYIGSFKFDDSITAVFPDYLDPDTWGLSETGNGDGYLSEFDYSQAAGWVYTINHWFASYGADKSFPGQEITDYNTGKPVVLGDVIRWHFTVAGWGADCGIPGNAMAETWGGNLIEQQDKSDLIFALAAINDYYGNLDTDTVYETALAVAAEPLSTAEDIAAQEAVLAAYIAETFFSEPEQEEPREAQSVSTVLNATMTKLAATVTAPSFGTNAGEWTVFGLARGNHFAKDNAYFTDYYKRIEEYVNTTAAEVNKNGVLDNNKSTENSRLIVALSAIGKNATTVGNWNLIAPYENFDWIKKQGINGTAWALLALDSNNYATADTTIRQQCINSILSQQHDDGGWSMVDMKNLASNVDVTGMVLTSLYPYRDQEAVAAACEKAIAWLSSVQLTTGGFPYGGAETSESCVWVVVALSTWGINPDTDSRFIKEGNSAVDNLLSYYLEDEGMFAHQGTVSNNMATDQALYALVAYDRLINGKTALFDYSDVTFEEPQDVGFKAILSIPTNVNPEFNANVLVTQWDNDGGYKLVDFVMSIPKALEVTDVKQGGNFTGGSVSYNLETNNDPESDSNILRCAYFDANENKDLTLEGTGLPATLFTISFKIREGATVEKLKFAQFVMSVKTTSDTSQENHQIAVDTTVPKNDVTVGGSGGGTGGGTNTLNIETWDLYVGDDKDLIPSTKKAVAVAITGIDDYSTLLYDDGTNAPIHFKYSHEIKTKTNVVTFVALVDAKIPTANFKNEQYLTINGSDVAQNNIIFGNADATDQRINAQDALAVVDAWLRKGDPITDDQILTMNVNGDSRINTLDALGIVEHFVQNTDYGVVNKALTTQNQT